MDLKKLLIERLEEKDVEPVLIPGLLKNILATLKNGFEINYEEE